MINFGVGNPSNPGSTPLGNSQSGNNLGLGAALPQYVSNGNQGIYNPQGFDPSIQDTRYQQMVTSPVDPSQQSAYQFSVDNPIADPQFQNDNLGEVYYYGRLQGKNPPKKLNVTRDPNNDRYGAIPESAILGYGKRGGQKIRKWFSHGLDQTRAKGNAEKDGLEFDNFTSFVKRYGDVNDLDNYVTEEVFSDGYGDTWRDPTAALEPGLFPVSASPEVQLSQKEQRAVDADRRKASASWEYNDGGLVRRGDDEMIKGPSTGYMAGGIAGEQPQSPVQQQLPESEDTEQLINAALMAIDPNSELSEGQREAIIALFNDTFGPDALEQLREEYMGHDEVDAKLTPGEVVVPKNKVLQAGGGNEDVGASNIMRMVDEMNSLQGGEPAAALGGAGGIAAALGGR